MLMGAYGVEDLKADAISSTRLDIFLALVAAAAAAVAVWRSILAGRQAREARKSRELTAVISLFNAYESEGDSGSGGSSGEASWVTGSTTRRSGSSCVTTSTSSTSSAMLRARRLLSDELVRDLFYEAAKVCWEQCAKSYVREIRATQNEDFARELQEWIGAPDP